MPHRHHCGRRGVGSRQLQALVERAAMMRDLPFRSRDQRAIVESGQAQSQIGGSRRFRRWICNAKSLVGFQWPPHALAAASYHSAGGALRGSISRSAARDGRRISSSWRFWPVLFARPRLAASIGQLAINSASAFRAQLGRLPNILAARSDRRQIPTGSRMGVRQYVALSFDSNKRNLGCRAAVRAGSNPLAGTPAARYLRSDRQLGVRELRRVFAREAMFISDLERVFA